MEIVIIVTLVLALVAALVVALAPSLNMAAFALVGVSFFLSCVFAFLGVLWVAVFELLLGGVLSALLLVSVNIMSSPRCKRWEHGRKKLPSVRKLPFILIFSGLIIVCLVLLSNFHIVVEVEQKWEHVRQAFLQARQADLLAQIFVLLAGAVALIALLKGVRKS